VALEVAAGVAGDEVEALQHLRGVPPELPHPFVGVGELHRFEPRQPARGVVEVVEGAEGVGVEAGFAVEGDEGEPFGVERHHQSGEVDLLPAGVELRKARRAVRGGEAPAAFDEVNEPRFLRFVLPEGVAGEDVAIP